MTIEAQNEGISGSAAAGQAPASGRAPSARRAQRREATVAELLSQAEAVAAAEGLEALTMHRLAALHGVRVAALYRYWPSKDALLTALLGRVFDQLFSAIREARREVDAAPSAELDAAGGGRALGRVVAAARAYLRFSDARPEASALLTRSLAMPRPVVPDEASAPTLLARVLALAEEVGADFEAARLGGALGTGDDAGRMALLWTSLQGLVAARKMSRFGVGGPFGALETELVRALLSGWGAPPATLEAAFEAAARAEGLGPAPGAISVTMAGSEPARSGRT